MVSKAKIDETRIKRLRYRANHRGIREMDIILGGFANDCITGLSTNQLAAFEMLIEENDRDLLNWYTGKVPFPHEDLRKIFERVYAHMIRQAG